MPPAEGPKRRPGDWHRSLPRWALEVHFGRGDLAVADRLPNFQRVYDRPDRLLDRCHLDRQLSRAEAERELLKRAAAGCGVGTVQDLADYYRMSPRDAAPRIAELVDAGDLVEANVEGWSAPGYACPNAITPRKVESRRLLSPFDPLVWFRPRAERLFDFHYRIEIYVPAAKRKWGYYVLPFLLDDEIVARVDLKAERKVKTLMVLAAHPEPGVDIDQVAVALAKELQDLAGWLGLERIKVSRRGPLGKALASACTRR